MQPQDILIPTTFDALIGQDREIFTIFNLNDSYVIETMLYGWFYRRDQRALYDLLAENLLDSRVALGDASFRLYREQFDDYFEAMLKVMGRVEPHLLGQDRRDNTAVDYVSVVDVQFNSPSPYFIVRIHYETS